MLIFGILLGLIILVLLVAVHELGHGIVAKRNGVVVEEFGIGFPPKAWGKKIKNSILGKNVLFTLNYLPLGGFVKLQGEHDAAEGPGDYGAATYWQKTRILLAGVIMNWVVAIVLLSALAVTGLPKILPNQFSVASDTQIVKEPLNIVQITPDSAAQKAGLERGDEILQVNGQPITTSAELAQSTLDNKGTTISVLYERGDMQKTIDVPLPAETTKDKGYLGVGAASREFIKASWSAPIVGIATTAQFTWVTLTGTANVAGDAITGAVRSLSPNETTRQAGAEDLNTVSESVAGPVGILGQLFPAAQQAGFGTLVFFTAIISLSLAVMNTLPIPALDGGRWFTMTVFKLLKKPLTKEREEKIQAFGFFFLIGLVILITFADVGKFTG